MVCTGKIDKSCIDWKMMELERKLVSKGCRYDGKPGLSNTDFQKLEANDKEAQALVKYYQTRFSFVRFKTLRDAFSRTGANVRNGVIEIVKNGNGSEYQLVGFQSFGAVPRLVRHFGGAVFTTENKLGPKDQEKLIKYLVEELNKKGVHFRKEDISLRLNDQAGFLTPITKGFEHSITFPSPACGNPALAGFLKNALDGMVSGAVNAIRSGKPEINK